MPFAHRAATRVQGFRLLLWAKGARFKARSFLLALIWALLCAITSDEIDLSARKVCIGDRRGVRRP
jgi:hypothetical protein